MPRRERLSGLDASFIYLERPHAPSHGGFLSFVDGPIDFERFRIDLESKLGRLRRYRQVIVRPPFNVAYPSWEFYPHFEMDEHVHLIECDPPISKEGARQFAIDLYHQGMDRRKPLWAFHVVNGVEGGAALINFVHHAMVDGAADDAITNIIFEERSKVDQGDTISLDGVALPGAVRQFFDGLVDEGAAIWSSLKDAPRTIGTVVRGIGSENFRAGRRLMKAYRRAPGLRFPFDRCPSGKVDLAYTRLELDAMKAVGAAYGAKVNDVLLAVVAGAMRRYALECGLDPEGKFFKFQVPVNVRVPDRHGVLGNRAAAVPVLAPLEDMDPVDRLRAIIANTQHVKRVSLAHGINFAIELIHGLMTPPVQSVVERVYGARWMSRIEAKLPLTPTANLFVTNLPRSQYPMYVAGQEVVSRHVMVPLLPNHSLVCGALTHGPMLEVCYLGCARLSPGVKRIAAHTEAAFSELAEAALERAIEQPRIITRSA